MRCCNRFQLTGRRMCGFRPAVSFLLFGAVFGCGEEGRSPAGPDTDPSFASAADQPAFRQVSASPGANQTCGVTTDNRAFCWGSGYLGNGPASQSLTPVLVPGGLQFLSVSAGRNHTCGVTTDFRVYCWGSNLSGELGDGTRTTRTTPTRVTGSRQYRQVTAGSFHTCALTRDNRAFCWGSNNHGTLGDGTTTDRNSPVAVVGGHSFRSVSAGFLHTCGVTTSNAAFCWGNNHQGELGDGSTVLERSAPVKVAGGRSWRQVSAGFDHTCGATLTDRGFCWGNGGSGQIGDGKTYQRWTPRAVAGGLSFERLSAGVFHTCGETTTNRAYCWGSNTYGALGNGTAGDPHLTPGPVVGGHFFGQVSAGGFYTCGVTGENALFCWGYNFGGALGDGTREDRWVPTPVAWEEEMW